MASAVAQAYSVCMTIFIPETNSIHVDNNHSTATLQTDRQTDRHAHTTHTDTTRRIYQTLTTIG